MDQDNYTQIILEKAVKEYLQNKIPTSRDGLQLLMNDPDQVVWNIACQIYKESGYQLDFSVIRSLIDPRISYLQDFLAEQEAKKLLEEKRLAEERRIAEEKRLAEQQRLAEERCIAEEKRLAEKQRLEEERRIAEEKRLAEQQRLAEERRIAEAKLAEERRIAEEKRLAEQQRLAEEKRLQLNRISQELIESGKDSSTIPILTQIIEILCDQLKINLESFNLSLDINIDSDNYANLLNTIKEKMKIYLQFPDSYYDELEFPCNLDKLLDSLIQRIIVWNKCFQQLKQNNQSFDHFVPILFKIIFILAESFDIEAEKIDLDTFITYYINDVKYNPSGNHTSSGSNFWNCSSSNFSLSDSFIHRMEMTQLIEEEFDIEMPDQDIEEFATVQDVLNYVTKKISS